MNALKNYNYQNIMIFFTFFLLWISIQFGEVVEDFLAYAMVISVGILHGANDLLILSVKDKKNKSVLKNLLIYIGIILLCLGIYFNLAIWYKLTDKTRYGMYFSIFGAIITIIVNITSRRL